MKKSLLIFVMSVVATVVTMAQVTTSAISGTVTDKNEELIGATIVATHTPSGTTYGAVTNANGKYDIQGMRVGGPYTIKVSYIGYQTKVFNDVNLALGETFNLNVWLEFANDQLEEVIVLGKASKFAGQKTGAAININNESLSAMPTISRSVSDIARLSPYAGASNSFAGGDGRSTNFTIDGANFNNNFGLTANLPGGGNPVSLDAIDEIQVVVAPFDVRQSNFIGGGINAITKSGTNKFKGTAYIYYNDHQLRGNRIDGEELGARALEKKTTYGFTLGGPIIENKLFFFANYETTMGRSNVIKYHAKGHDGSGIESACTLADMNTVSDILKNKYGYNTGSATDFPTDEPNHKFLARLDWNINDNHHLSVRYNVTKNTQWNETNGNSTDAGTRDRTTNRVGETSMAFANSMYSMENNVQSWALDLNSRFGSDMQNQLLATYSDIEDVRGTNSDIFPFIDIMDGSNHHYMAAGYELFSYNNAVNNKIFNVKDDFKYNWDAHKFLVGVNFEHQMANNAYMRNATGYYRFSSLQDFIDCKPEAAAFTYGFNGEKEPNAQVTFNQLSWYAQDEWNVTNNFKLNLGIRFDDMMFDNSDIERNVAIYKLDFNGTKIDTGMWPENAVQVSPRVGFSWDINGDNSMKLRGGTGLFAGRLPLVFFTNMPTNANLVQNSVTKIGGADLEKLVVNGKFLTTIDEMVAALGKPTQIDETMHTAGSKICGVANDFKMPQVWKTSVAFDYNAPVDFPLSMTAEAMFTKNVSACYIDNINFKESESTFKGADNRPYYDNSYVQTPIKDGKAVTAKPAYYTGTSNAVVLKNTDKGYGYTLNYTVNAEPVENLKLMAAFTHTESKEVSGMPGSDPVSTWQGLYVTKNANDLKLQRSRYVTPNKLIASVNYYIPFKYKNLLRGTSINLFYQGYNYSNNTFVYSNDLNGDGIVNDLMYIPANDSEIVFKNDEDGSQRKAFWAFVDQDKYLKNHKGEYAESYSARAPWYNQFDLRIVEDFGFKVGSTDHKFQLSFDIQNVGNLLNSHWGVPQYCGNTTNTIAPLTFEGINAEGIPTFSMNKKMTETYSAYKLYSNCWKLQVGLKYFFN